MAPGMARADDPPISEEARRHFKAGVAFMQDPDGEKTEEAYREFKTAFDLSGSPKILGNMGVCAMKLERDGEAIDAFSRYLREVTDIEPSERTQIQQDLATLTVSVVRIHLTVTPADARVVDVRVPVRGDRITNTYAAKNGKIEIGVRPGHHIFTAKANGYNEETWEAEAHAGGKEEHAFVLKKPEAALPPPPPVTTPVVERKSNPWPWVLTGVGGAMIGAGVVTGILALGKTSDIEKKCPNDMCPVNYDLEGERGSARTLVTLTDVFLIGGGVLAAGGLTWAILSSSSEKPSNTSAFCTHLGCSVRVKF
jgi:hypothetical protein